MQITGAWPQPTEWETLGGLASNLCLKRPYRWFWFTLMFENHWCGFLGEKGTGLRQLSSYHRGCWVTMETALLLLNRKQPSTPMAPRGSRKFRAVTLWGHCCQKKAKGDDRNKVWRNSLKYLEKHTQHPVIIYIWWLVYCLGFWGEGRAGWRSGVSRCNYTQNG